MGQKIRKRLTEEKGSITVLVTSVMLFMLVILAISFSTITNKISAQKKEIKRIEQQYNEGNIAEEYQKAL